jgi:hypothetical protein
MMCNALNPTSHGDRCEIEQRNELQEIFDRHWKMLSSQMIMSTMNIRTWCEMAVASIQRHAEEQIGILEDDFKRQQQDFHEAREENSDTFQAWTEAQEFGLRAELSYQCRLLQFQVAQLENVKCVMEYPHIVTAAERIAREKHRTLDKKTSPHETDENGSILTSHSEMEQTKRKRRQSSTSVTPTTIDQAE